MRSAGLEGSRATRRGETKYRFHAGRQDARPEWSEISRGQDDARQPYSQREWYAEICQLVKIQAFWVVLSSITRTDVRTLHARIGKNHGHYAANRLLALLRSLFNRAGELGYAGDNPTKGVRKFKEQSRDRYLQPDELPKFMAAVQSEPNGTLRDFFLMLLYTGARRANVQAMAWARSRLARNWASIE